MSGKRWDTAARDWCYRFLVQRNGGREECRRCKAKPKKPKGLFIDHIDDNRLNRDPDNLRLLCPGCNTQTAWEHAKGLPDFEGKLIGAVSGCVSERDSTPDRMAAVRSVLDYQSGSMEMRASDLFAVAFGQWLQEYVRDHTTISRKEAIASGAYKVGCSTISASRYIDPLVSELGPLMEVKDTFHKTMIVARPKAIDQPKEGKP